MHIVNGVIGLFLAALAILHGTMPGSMQSALAFAVGSLLAFLTLLPNMSTAVARAFAVITTVCMFFYFAGFFSLAPELHSEWYRGMQARAAFSLLLAAFCMIPVLSCYSCRLKADCHESVQRKRRGGFFSVPSEAKQHS